MEKIAVNLMNGANGSTITILEGQALEQKEPAKIKLEGNIDAVKEFLSKRTVINGDVLQQLDKKKAVIIVDEDKMYIQLLLDPENQDGTEVMAKLEFTTYLKDFHINGQRTFTREELIKLLRFSKPLFDNSDKHEALLKAYQTFDFSASINAATDSDLRGNKKNSLAKVITTNLPADFILGLPIFKGQQKETFRVEICYDTTDASIKFWFESVELAQLIDQRKIEIFEESLAGYQDYVIIKK